MIGMIISYPCPILHVVLKNHMSHIAYITSYTIHYYSLEYICMYLIIYMVCVCVCYICIMYIIWYFLCIHIYLFPFVPKKIFLYPPKIKRKIYITKTVFYLISIKLYISLHISLFTIQFTPD